MGNRVKVRRIWERDGGRCGIHLGGCGKPLRVREATIGHIIPKALLRTAGNRQYDEVRSERAGKAFEEEGRDKRWIDSNVQPMHRECNEEMGVRFPLDEMAHHCTCCRWIYLVEDKEGRVNIVRGEKGWDLDWEWEGRYLLFRRMWIASSERIDGVIIPLGEPPKGREEQRGIPTRMQLFLDAEHKNPVSPVMIPVIIEKRDGALQAGGQVGGWVGLDHMLRQNARYSEEELSGFDGKRLSKVERDDQE